ncbi:MAG: type II secretion system F family protein [Lentisphaeria bacterium]
MPTFQYIAMDGSGKEQKGRIDASNQQDAATQLKQQGLFATSITEAKSSKKTGGEKAKKNAPAKAKKKPMMLTTPVMKRKKLMNFTRQLATLLDAGQALVRALRTLEKQARKDVASQVIIGELADSVEGGTTFSEALNSHPKTFSKLYVSMVRAGEAAGQLDGTLDNLALFMEKAERVRGRVKSAMTYPVVVLVIALTITGFLMVFIVPKFEKIFADMLSGDPLPALTNFVISISVIMKDHSLVAIGVVVGFVVLLKLAKKTSKGAFVFDYLMVKLPPINQLVVRSTVSRMTRTLGTLMGSGVSVLQALQIARDTAGNEVMARAMQDVHDAVKEGEGMSQPLQNTGVFPAIVISMVEVGEETGALPNMLTRIADVYEEEVDRAVESVTAMMEPIMIVFLAGIVGTIVIAMFLPLVKLITELGGA